MSDQELSNTTQQTNSDSDLKSQLESLKRELAELRSKTVPEKTPIEQKIDLLVEERIKQYKQGEDERIQNARKIIEEAEENAKLEKELQENTKYRIQSDYIERKEREFMTAMTELKKLTNNGKYFKDFFEETKYSRQAQGKAKLALLASHYTPIQALNMLRKNLGYNTIPENNN